MNKINPKDLEKIISDEASEDMIRNFDEIFRETPMEKTDPEFTDSVIRKFNTETFAQKYSVKLTSVALAIIVTLSLIIIMLYDTFSIPTMSDPILEHWMEPVNESTGFIKQLIMIVDSILMLILIDRFALRPFFKH